MTRLADAIYRLALRSFPAAFRRRHGAAMLEQFRAQRTAVRGRPIALAALWARAIADAIGHGLATRFDTPRSKGAGPMRSLQQDLLHTWRSVRARPGATLATVAVLALGIGLTSAMFALADPFLLRPLPYANPDRLARIELRSENRRPGPFPALADFAARADLFEAVAAYTPIDALRLRLRLPDSDVMLTTAAVSGSFFSVLGLPIVVPPEWGAAAARGETPVVLLPDADARVRALPIGTAVPAQDGTVIRIVGALAEGFVFPRNRVSPALSAIAPLADGPLMEVRIRPDGGSSSSTSRDVIARLRDGVTPELAASVLSPPSEDRAYSLRAEWLRPYLIGRHDALALGAVLAGLLIAAGCAANLTNLLLARASFRTVEMATRKALGASRLDLARLVLVELAAIAAAGVAAGLTLAHFALGVAGAVIPADYVALGAPALTWRVVVFGIGLGAAIVAAGVLPILAVWRLAPAAPLVHRVAPDSRQFRRLRTVMAAGQSAVAMILLAGAALLGRSFLNLASQDTGFAGDPVVVSVSYPPARGRDLLQQDVDATIERLRRLPDVNAVAAATGAMVDSYASMTALSIDGKGRPVQTKHVTAGYFDAAGTPIVAGRGLDDRDRGVQGIVVNRRAAAQFWPDGAALGRLIPWGKGAATVVGIAADSHDQALDVAPVPMIYALLDAPASAGRVSFVIRSATSAAALRRPVERVIAGVNRDAIVTDVSGVGARLADSVRDRVFATLVAAMFAVAGIGVCAFGLVGVVSYAVARRTREIAIRSAIGAEPRHVRRLVMREALIAAAGGTAAGLAAAWWASRWLGSLLYGITPGEPVTMAAGAAAMLTVVAVAAWLPARRALRLSPTRALRTE